CHFNWNHDSKKSQVNWAVTGQVKDIKYVLCVPSCNSGIELLLQLRAKCQAVKLSPVDLRLTLMSSADSSRHHHS
ncbi:hypothetical protein Bpfe_025061, partial [Biomphalaria pfeifferi]